MSAGDCVKNRSEFGVLHLPEHLQEACLLGCRGKALQ
jgi:hypothetical protein